MAGLLPPVVATLLADTKEYSAKMDQATGKMEAFGGVADTTGKRFGNFANKASTAIIGAGVAIGAVGIDFAIKFQTALDQVQNTTNATAEDLKKIAASATNLSNVTVNSATDIVGAYQAVEAAGYGWAKAQDTVTAAAKLAQITQQSVITTTQSLVAAQELGITKGMSSAKVADLFSIALRGNEAGLAGVVALLQGKVGAAFAQYHQSAAEAVSIANVLSLAHYSNTRALAALIGKIGEFQTEMVKTTITNGKVTKSTSAWVDALLSAGLNVDKTKTAFTGPNGLINGLKYLQTVSHGSLSTLNKDLIAVFGTSGSAAAALLITRLDQITKTTKAAAGASPTGLNKAFNLSQKNIDNQLKELKNRAENILRGIGMFLLPGVTDLAKWATTATKYFEQHPLLKKIASDSAIGLFAAAIALKLAGGIASAVNGIRTLFGGSATATQTATIVTPLDLIASNTTDMVALMSKGLFPNGGGPTLLKDAAPAAEGAGGVALVEKYGLKAILKTALDYSIPIAIIAGQKNAEVNVSTGPNVNYKGKTYGSQVIGDHTFVNLNDPIVTANNATFTGNTKIPGFPGDSLGPQKKKPGKVTINVGFHK